MADISEAYEQSLSKWSPDGQWVAGACGFRITVRTLSSTAEDLENARNNEQDDDRNITLKLHECWTCVDKIDKLEWSADSQYVCCLIARRQCAQVFSIDDPDWRCRIDEGLAGLVNCMWAPCARQIVTVSEFQVKMSVWSLIDRTSTDLAPPKHPNKGLAFNKNGEYLAVLSRKDCVDSLTIYGTEHWELAQHVNLATNDAADIAWVAHDTQFIVWDGPLHCRLLFYDIMGECLHTVEPYTKQLGIRSINFSPDGKLMTMACYDGKARIVNVLCGKVLKSLPHDSQQTPAGGDEQVMVYREDFASDNPVASHIHRHGGNASESGYAKYVFLEAGAPSIRIPTVSRPKANAFSDDRHVLLQDAAAAGGNCPFRIGIAAAAWSPDCRYLATRTDEQPTVVRIWDILRFKLASILIQRSAVKDFAWDPSGHRDFARLMITTGEQRVFLWRPTEAQVMDFGFNFRPARIIWSPTGENLLFQSKDHICVAALAPCVDNLATPLRKSFETNEVGRLTERLMSQHLVN